MNPAIPDTLTTLLERHARERGEQLFCQLFLEEGAPRLTYAELLRQSRRYAHFYRGHGAEDGEVIPLFLPHGVDLFPAFLGAMLAGCIPSFMPPLSAKQEPQLYWQAHRELLKRIRARLILVSPEMANPGDNLDFRHGTVLTPDPGDDESPINRATDPEAIALLQHSSGTTGLKKGVALSHRAILRQIDCYAAALDLQPTDRIATWLPLYHDMGLLACFLTPLVRGLSIVALDPFEWVLRPERLFEAVERYRCSHVWLPNFAYHHLCRTVEQPPRDLSSLKALINCSEPCKAETFRLFSETFPTIAAEKLQICYAMAETVFAATQTTPGQVVTPLAADRRALLEGNRYRPAAADSTIQWIMPVGRPIEGIAVRVVNEGVDAAEGEVGEVILAGDFLFSSYFGLPELTRERLQNGWYHSNDLGFLWQGELYITGRKDDLIICHGKNIYAHDVEEAVNRVPGVKPGRAVAFAHFDAAQGSQEIVVVAETEMGDADLLKGMRRAVATLLQSLFQVRVSRIRLVEPGWLVKTTSGKVSRKENLKKWLRELD
ncbi:MAG: AMP-binding protein [Magnetococcales bacterium]|nr:AMP-binding protein [Magnetococcales bacterium]